MEVCAIARQLVGTALEKDNGEDLVYSVFSKICHTFPHTLVQQLHSGFPVDQAHIHPGDLLFFQKDNQELQVCILSEKNTIFTCNSSTKTFIEVLLSKSFYSKVVRCRRCWAKTEVLITCNDMVFVTDRNPYLLLRSEDQGRIGKVLQIQKEGDLCKCFVSGYNQWFNINVLANIPKSDIF